MSDRAAGWENWNPEADLAKMAYNPTENNQFTLSGFDGTGSSHAERAAQWQPFSNQAISSFFNQNQGNPDLIASTANKFGIGLDRIIAATGSNQQAAQNYMSNAGYTYGANGFQKSPAGAVGTPAMASGGVAGATSQATSTPYAGAWKDFNFQDAIKQTPDAQNGNSIFHNGYWMNPVYGNQKWVGQGEDSYLDHGDPTEYWITKDLGNGSGGWGGGGSAQYEGAQYDRVDGSGNYLGTDTYKNMGTDGFTKAMAALAAIAATYGVGSTIAGAGTAAGAGTGAGAGGTGVTVGGPMSTGLPTGTALGAAGAGAGAAGGAGIAGTIAQALGGAKGLGTVASLIGALTGGGGGSSGGGSTGGLGLGGGIADILSLITAGLGSKRTADAGKDMTAWLDKQQAKVDNLYAPGSPEYNYLWNEMSRKDAAAGRNSQYGPRSVDLAAKIAEIKANNTAKMTTGIGNTYAASLNQNANAYAGIPALLASMGVQNGGGTGGNIASILKLLGGSNLSDNLTNDLPAGVDPNDALDWWMQYGTGGD